MKIRFNTTLPALAIIAASGFATDLCNGDLLFQINESSGFTDAIVAATGADNRPTYSHVAIVSVKGDSTYVIEASSKNGVHILSLQEFLAGSAHNEMGKPLVVAKRIKQPSVVADSAVKRAEKHIGEPYDHYFMPDNGAMYCSELVYESYITPRGTHVFKANPMRFRDKDGNMPEYWTKLFSRLGEPIPEGVLGTNPNDMSNDTCLVTVMKFF